MIKIQNRRYIGSKTKLIENIYEAVIEENLNIECPIFADVFGGTGVVAHHFAEKGYQIIVNDILYSNYVSYKTWFSNQKIGEEKINNILKYFNGIDPSKLEENYFSKTYGGKYFSNNDCKKIGYIRDYIENHKEEFNEREYFYLITTLMYTVDKIANTVGHFESFLSKEPQDSDFQLQMLNTMNFENTFIYNIDSNELIKNISCDILYLDPPYNARQYVNFYHVLENLARWEKPTEFEGNSMKFKRNHLKSGYSRSVASKLFEELVMTAKCKLIIVSYNNTYSAKSSASNNKISEEKLVEILNKKGEVKVKEIKHKFFNSGKTDFTNHMEKIYVCKVR